MYSTTLLPLYSPSPLYSFDFSLNQGEIYHIATYQAAMSRKGAVASFSHWYSIYSSPSLQRRPKPSPRPTREITKALASPRQPSEPKGPSRTSPKVRLTKVQARKKKEREELLRMYKKRQRERRAQHLAALSHQNDKAWDMDVSIEYEPSEAFSLITRELEEEKLLNRLWISQVSPSLSHACRSDATWRLDAYPIRIGPLISRS